MNAHGGSSFHDSEKGEWTAQSGSGMEAVAFLMRSPRL